MATDYHAQLCHLAGTAIADFDLIREGDRLLVAVSGGVDSMMLMHVLERLRRKAPIRFELYAVTIDEGFEGIDHSRLTGYAAAQGWNHRIIQAPIARLIREKQAEKRPCALCSRLRRGFIHGQADDLACNRIALGHHRDDLCVSLLMGLFRGTGLKTMSPNVPADNNTKRIIRPLCYASKNLIETAARGMELPDVGSCDFANQLNDSGDRAYLERLLPELESHFPNLGKNMLNCMGDIRPEFLLDRRLLGLLARSKDSGI